MTCMFKSLPAAVMAVSLAGGLASPVFANHVHYPSHWAHNSSRWSGLNWSRSDLYNHWRHPCGGLGCNPHTWGPSDRTIRWTRDWSRDRFWGHGWYGRHYYRDWGWWGARAAAWGIGSLATAAVINGAINAAIDDNRTSFDVPETPYQLDYQTMRVPADRVTTFVVRRDGVAYQMDADCADGELNGQAPSTDAEAQLLNAACQVAFGDGS